MPDTLYYDGQCPLCAKEIARLKELSSHSLELRDIHDSECDQTLPSKDVLLRDLHLRTGDGNFLTGMDANVAAWQHTPLGFLWRWLRWPLLRPLADLGYRRWASWRYRRLYGDQSAGGSDA